MVLTAYNAARLPWPTDWDDIFGREAPLILEIGFGNAEFLVDLARRHPHANIAGIEISLPSIKKAERKLSRLPHQNGRVIHGDARLLLWGAIPEEALQALYINFPDPWHKAAHHHRKLINDEFLNLIATRMRADALLDIATDDPGYQEVITAALGRTPYFDSRLDAPFATNDKTRLQTKYEAKALAEGRTCHYYKWRRNDTPPAQPYPHPQEHPMPHVIIKTPLTLAEIRDRFTEQRFAGPPPIRLHQIYTAHNPLEPPDSGDVDRDPCR